MKFIFKLLSYSIGCLLLFVIISFFSYVFSLNIDDGSFEIGWPFVFYWREWLSEDLLHGGFGHKSHFYWDIAICLVCSILVIELISYFRPQSS